MPAAEKTELMQRITGIGERAASGTGIEIADIQLKGGGKARLLRVYVDKPGGITHGDCELISERMSRLLDEEDAVPGDSYTLEVSSLGVERPLSKLRDFERVIGQKIRLISTQPIEGQTHLEGKLLRASDGVLELETTAGRTVHVSLQQVQKANLKFEW